MVYLRHLQWKEDQARLSWSWWLPRIQEQHQRCRLWDFRPWISERCYKFNKINAEAIVKVKMNSSGIHWKLHSYQLYTNKREKIENLAKSTIVDDLFGVGTLKLLSLFIYLFFVCAGPMNHLDTLKSRWT